MSLDQAGSNYITLARLLDLARSCDWSTVVDGKPLRQWLTRKAEKYPAWRSPRTRGQGKNIDEFIRVLYRSSDDDSGSGLLIRCPPGDNYQDRSRPSPPPAFRVARRAEPSCGHWDARKASWCSGTSSGTSTMTTGLTSAPVPLVVPCSWRSSWKEGFSWGVPDAGESAEVLDTLGTSEVFCVNTLSRVLSPISLPKHVVCCSIPRTRLQADLPWPHRIACS